MHYKGHQLRHEFKYYINYHEYTYLKARLEGIMAYDKNSGKDGYHIRSLYFDDVYDTALNEKMSGVQFRQKYRIRIYNKQEHVIKLERKEKYRDTISKQSLTLSKEQFYHIIENDNIDFLLHSEKEMPQQMFWHIRTRQLAPAVVVDYQREVFTCEEGNVRITFDKNLEAGIDPADIFDPKMTIVQAFPPDALILEVKYDDYIPDYILNALQIHSHKKEAISKYVYCRMVQLKWNPARRVLRKER